jgi:undecaprenyl-diphosphatase
VHLFIGGSLDPSFPSDHAAAAFAIAFAVLAYSRRVGVAFLAVAALIAVSRILEGLHYPSDVLAGAAVGAAAALVVTRVARPVVEWLAGAIGAATDPLVSRLDRALTAARRRR